MVTVTTPFTRKQQQQQPSLIRIHRTWISAVVVLLTLLAMVPSCTCTPSCSLECSHGTTCQRLHGNDSSWMMTSGRMIESCGTCPPKWTGIACDIPMVQHICSCTHGEECLESNNNNNNNNNMECGDRCAVADQVSIFAGTMCRSPITEYCEPFFPNGTRNGTLSDPYDSFHYCTHGGTCVHDTTINDTSSFSCNCTPEFNGPHCEALILPAGLFLEEWFVLQMDQDGFTDRAIAALSGVVVGCTIAFIVMRRRQATLRESFFRESDNMWKAEEEMVTFEKPRTSTHSFAVV